MPMGTPNQGLDSAGRNRNSVIADLAFERKSNLGQFMTPAPVASFMASLFPPSSLDTCKLLDAGAGAGALTSAFLDRWRRADGFSFRRVEAETYEVDSAMRRKLDSRLALYVDQMDFEYRVFEKDFIEAAAFGSMVRVRFTHAIMNPPYKKINSTSNHRSPIAAGGDKTVNLYSAFVALALYLMKPGGQIVAIIPRSFCNGPYYRPFREFLLSRLGSATYPPVRITGEGI